MSDKTVRDGNREQSRVKNLLTVLVIMIAYSPNGRESL